LWGYKSELYFLPESGVGAVILTNSDNGGLINRPFMRRLLEILFDGKPEAEADIAAAAKRHYALLAKERERLVVPADATEAAKLGKHYHNAALGDIDVSTKDNATTFDFGEWKSTVSSRKNDDGTISFIT